MIVSPIIPIWLMIIICIILIILIRTKNIIVFFRRFIIIVLLFAINLRVMMESENISTMSPSNNLDVLFVIDSTISMEAEDYNGNNTRLDAVKKDCKYIMDELAGSKFSIITFKTVSQIRMPYTKDTTMANDVLDIIRVDSEYDARGSSLNVPKEDMIKCLKSSKQKGDRNRVVFFISDGEITNDEKLESYSEAKKYIDNGAVLGYGTEAGGQMKVSYYSSIYFDTEKEYLKDTSSFPYKVALSKIDENNLRTIADDLGIDYIHMQKQSDIDKKIKEIKSKLIKEQNMEEKKKSYTDTYYILVIPLSLILIYEFINYKRRL